MTVRRILSSLVLCLLLVPAAASAQAPGYQGPGPRELRAQYRAAIVVEMNETMAEWAAAWSGDDVEALEEVYTEDAVVFPPDGGAIRGWTAIRAWLDETLPDQGSAEAYLQDFDVGGEMAMSHSSYRIQNGAGGLSGELITVVMRKGRRWKIRSQVFRQH